MSDTTTMIMNCMNTGPNIGEEGEVVSCGLPKGHYSGSSWHQWWNDDGTVRMAWADDWVLGEGRWRNE